MTDHIAAINRLTTAWLERHDEESGVLAGAGAWPLLAILAASADSPGREELATAVGLDADEAMTAAHLAITTMDQADGVDAAFGFWAQQAADVRPEWRDELPPGTVGELSGDAARDQPVLDAWARDRTRGLIDHLPVETGPDLMLTLATALALKTTWLRPFTDTGFAVKTGPWAGKRVAGLTRDDRDLDQVRVAATPSGPVTLTRVEGDNGIDVHLVLGEESAPASEVLTSAMLALTNESLPAQTGSELLSDRPTDLGPGLSVVRTTHESVKLTTVRFTVQSEHDLLANADIFGLEKVRTSGPGGRGHFSSISEVPLVVDQARQSAIAIFSATGFEAAAVTAMGLRTTSMPMHNAYGLSVTYNRPFGFIAVHRTTGLALFAGWVSDPEAPRRG